METHSGVPAPSSARQLEHSELSRLVIGGFYTVYNALGYGLLESVHAHALRVELQRLGLPYRAEVPFEVTYRGVNVGVFRADLVVAGTLLVEVKSSHAVTKIDFRQILNYLKVSHLPIGLLLHFGPQPDFHRVVLKK